MIVHAPHPAPETGRGAVRAIVALAASLCNDVGFGTTELRTGSRPRCWPAITTTTELPSETGHVPEVLHMGVPVTQTGHRVELLGDHRLTQVRPETGSGEVEQCGVVLLLAAEGDDVTEADAFRVKRFTSSEAEGRWRKRLTA